MSNEPHSAEYFGAQRDYWWNRDFLDLMAARWRLREASSLADIGCGLGHWSRLLYSYLRRPARLAGVDREPRWVAEALQEFRRVFPHVAPELISFHQSGTGPWEEEDLRRLVLLGGGTESFFKSVFAEILERYRAEQRALAAGTFHAAGGSLTYLVSARKP